MRRILPYLAPLLLIVSFLFALPTIAQSPSLAPVKLQIGKAFRGTGCSTGPTACRASVEQISLNTLPGISRTSSLQGKGHTFGALWEVGGGFTSTLILRNKDSINPVAANVILFSRDGGVEQESQIEVAPNSVGRLLLNSLIKTDTQSVHSGGLMLEFPDASAASTIGTVIIENYGKGLIFDLPLMGGDRYDTENALHAPWWLIDDGTDGDVTLFNQSDQNIVVSPSIIAEGTERITPSLLLAGHGTKRLSLRELLRQQGIRSNKGSIGLSYTGPAHALAPVLLLANPATGFSLVSPFNARHNQAEAGEAIWRFPDVFLSADPKLGFNKDLQLTAYAVLSNPTKSRIFPLLTAYVNDEHGQQATINLPTVPLEPLETRLINLSQFAASGLLPRKTPYISLAVSHNGVPGDLGLTIFSVGQTKDFVWPSKGLVRSGQTVDSVYWDISGDLVAFVVVQNTSDVPLQSKATLYYPTSHGAASYSLPLISVPANASRILNLKQAILAGVADSAGNVIPRNTTFGTLTLEVSDKASHGLIFGGSASFDPVKGKYGDPTNPPNCDNCNFPCLTCISADSFGGQCGTSCSDPSCCAPPPPTTVTGFINPKYVVLGVTYAPPGPSSNVTYTNSTLVGATTTVTNLTTSGVNTTVSVTKDLGAWTVVGGAATKITNSASTEYDQGSNSSTSTTISKQTSVSDMTNGTGDAFNPVNHDYDTIWIWLNPLLIFTVDPNNPATFQWNGYGYDPNDPSGTGGPDVFPVLVGWLNGHFGSNPSINTVLARGWVTTNEPGMTWPSGEGPGLTSADIATILQADPFTNASYALPSPLPSTTSDQRFTQISFPPNPIAYTQAGPGNGGGITTVYNAVYTNTSSVATGTTQTFTQAYGVEANFSGGTWLASFTVDVKQTHTFTFQHSWLNTLTTTTTLTDALSVTGPGCPQTSPPCSPLYSGPGQFIVFQDNMFGTFMFYPSN